jgi:hypothetical protein
MADLSAVENCLAHNSGLLNKKEQEKVLYWLKQEINQGKNDLSKRAQAYFYGTIYATLLTLLWINKISIASANTLGISIRLVGYRDNNSIIQTIYLTTADFLSKCGIYNNDLYVRVENLKKIRKHIKAITFN